MPVHEQPIAIEDVFKASLDGSLEEIFGTGTAAVISSVGELVWGDRHIVVNDNKLGSFTSEMFNALTGIQYGTSEDTHGWTIEV